MQKTDTSVQDLVSMIQRGELRLPEMQRGYVWRATRVRDLLDSLYRGYPSGNILVWETDGGTALRSMAVPQGSNPYSAHRLLLDGQQRLTSLSAVMRGERVHVRGRQRPIDILFNLEHPDTLVEVLEVEEDGDSDPDGLDDDDEDDEESIEERAQRLTFVVASRRLAALPHWVSVTQVMTESSDAPFLKKAGVQGFDDSRYEKYTKRLQQLRAIRNYMYSVQILERELAYEEVTEIFVRVNSLGAKLRSSDLALAQITARWSGALSVFEEFARECNEEKFSLPSGLLVRALVVHATGQSRFRTVSSIGLEQLKDGWERAKRGLRYAIHFLRNNAAMESPALLTSPFLALAVSFFAERQSFQLTSQEERALRFWTHVANGRGRYSRGSSESILDQDLAAIRDGRGLPALIDALKTQFGRLHFGVDEFEGKNQKSSLFRLMYLAQKAAGARDWNSGIEIALSSFGSEHKLQFHHVFPKAVLNQDFKPAQVNEIANLAFISGKTNRNISARAPLIYLPLAIEKTGVEAIRAHAIPTSPDLWTKERYLEFLRERRVLLVDMVNRFIGELPT
jgi:hypothetical protein